MSDDDTYEIPLQDQRVFGAGIKRKRVKFVPSSTTACTTSVPAARTAQSISDLYLNLVLPKDQSLTGQGSSSKAPPTTGSPPPEATLPPGKDEPTQSNICEICSLPFSTSSDKIDAPVEDPDLTSIEGVPRSKYRPHEASLAHQVCLTHSHPPSHIDRNRKGLKYLSEYGWDPDSRLGLGASGQGIQFPIKTKPKDDKLGIGVVLPKAADRRRKEKTTKLDAGKVRKMHEHDRKKSERLREMFYRNDDVERYLGGGV